MPEKVDEWIRKAEGDFRTALREFAATDESACDAVCFHAHQCIEKLMKAVLVARDVQPPRTHNLLFLDDLLCHEISGWSTLTEDIEWLTRGGVGFRYPGAFATRSHAARAMEICKQLRKQLLEQVGREEPDSDSF